MYSYEKNYNAYNKLNTSIVLLIGYVFLYSYICVHVLVCVHVWVPVRVWVHACELPVYDITLQVIVIL